MSITNAGARGRAAATLRVDWSACKGRGFCHELLPEIVDLDEWGYPIINGVVPPELIGLAKEAVRTCPTLALHLT